MAHPNAQPPQDDAPHPAEREERSNLPAPLAPVSTAVSTRNEAATNVLAAHARAEIEARTFMALKNPRDLLTFRLNLLQACKRPLFAAAARYAKPLGGQKYATGFSIRFAEECARQYKNLHIGSMVISDADEQRVIRVAATDLEANVTWTADVVVQKTVERRSPRPGDEVLSQRQNSTGQVVFRIRADDDALLVKQNALISKAARNLILDHVPSDIQEEADEEVTATLKNQDAKDPQGAVKKIADAFFGYGVMPQQVAEFLGHPLEQTTPAELQKLRTVLTALKEGEGSWADVTGKAAASEGAAPKSATERLRTATKKAPTPCATCGGVDGQHAPDCPHFAD